MYYWGRRQEIDYSDAPEYDHMREPINNAAYIPLRLTMPQRKQQRLMRGIMLASSYTDKVDIKMIDSKRKCCIAKEVHNVLRGFLTGLDVNNCHKLHQEKCYSPFKEHIVQAIEYCRRFKIMNPDLLRTDYVKFLYMLQDAVTLEEDLGFCIVSSILSVETYCKKLGIESLLQDEDLPLCITPVPNYENRTQLNKALRKKDVTVNKLVKHIQSKTGAEDDSIEIAIRSLNDANNFANSNADSAAQLLELLKRYFKPHEYMDATYLAITDGEDGARLTHKHEMQYRFVLQSLSLWKNICRRMFSLWMIAEDDLLDKNNPYELRETGQGLQRVQKAPQLLRAVQGILDDTKKELGEWVGLETIHLGDNQVPNAFHFIDKYGQISRIVVPILRTIEKVDDMAKDKHVNKYLEEVYGSAELAKLSVLQDFFRHGFDGSGGDTLEDAGSCIDGRLTSAWNWCNNIRHKKFYPLFLMAGFSSFDGDMSL